MSFTTKNSKQLILRIFDQGNKKIYQFGKYKASKKKYSKDFIKDLLRFAKKKGRVIKLKNNKGKDPKKLKAYDTGYIIAVRLNGKIVKFRYMKGRNQGFRFSVKINGKIYNFNSKGPGRVTLYRNHEKSFKEKRSVKKAKRSKKVKRSKKPKTTTRKRRTVGGSKRVSTKRKSPEKSATLYKVGTTKRGNDGNLWVVKKTSNGVKRWVKK